MTTSYAKDQPEGFVNRIERVAIIGASGQIGRPITEALLKTGKHTITGLTRGASALPSGVKAVTVDYDDEASVISALRGQQLLIISLSVASPPDLHDRIVTAAAEAGVPHIMPNIWGASIETFDKHEGFLLADTYLARVRKIEELGVKWTSLCCSYWYEFSLATPTSYGFDLKERKVTFFDDGKTKINTSTWEQCGRAVSAWLSLPALLQDENDTSKAVSSWSNKPLYMSSFLLSQRDMLDSLGRVTGTTDADWDISYEDVQERYKRGLGMMQKGDLVGFGIALYARTFFPDGSGDYETPRGLDNEVLGLPKESLDEATRRAVKRVEDK